MIAAWLALAAPAALAQDQLEDQACAQCHAPAGAMYLGQLAEPGAIAAGCPVLADLGARLRRAEDRMLGLERALAQAAAAGEWVDPAAAALTRAQGRLAWAKGRQLVAAAPARAGLAQVESLLSAEVDAPLTAQARRQRLAAGLGLGLLAGLGLLLAWLVGRRRALTPPAVDLLEAVRQGRLE
ncbi:MAG: hypothetical protein V1797_11680 [Pseudomonadota bacterium]